MKKASLLVLVVILVSFYWYFFSPTVKDLNSCFNDSATNSEQILEAVKKEKWTKVQVCENGEKLLSSLKSCLAAVKENRPLYSPIMQFSGVRSKAENMVSQHNQVCTDNLIVPIE